MELQQILGRTESCIVCGQRQSGKLTLVLALLQRFGCQQPCIITPFEKTAISRRLTQFSQLAQNHADCSAVDILYARPDWRKRKRELGFNYLIEDLLNAVRNVPGDAVVLHRIDEFFEVQDRVNIELFVSSLASGVKAADKRLFITLQHDEAFQLYQEQVEHYLDLELEISAQTDATNVRTVDLLYASLPVSSRSFQLRRASENSFVIENRTSSSPQLETGSEQFSRVLLVSDDELLKRRVGYLVQSQELQLRQVGSAMDVLLDELLARPDLIIFDAQEDNARDLMRVARGHHLKVLRISSDPHVRKLDRLKAAQSGYFDLLERDYYLEDLMLCMERALGKQLYDFDLGDRLEELRYTEDVTDLYERAQWFSENHLYFSVFSFRIPGISASDVQHQLVGRPYDQILFEPSTKTLKFFAPNLLKHNAALIEDKVKALDVTAELLAVQEAVEFEAEASVTCN